MLEIKILKFLVRQLGTRRQFNFKLKFALNPIKIIMSEKNEVI